MSSGYTFTKRSAERITRVVRDVERGGRDQLPIYFRRSGGDDGSSVLLRLGKTTGTWTKGTQATIDLYGDGEAPEETQSGSLENCMNRFATVQSGKWVMVALATNGSWYLISAEC